MLKVWHFLQRGRNTHAVSALRFYAKLPVDVVHDVLVHLLLARRGRLVLRVGARVDDAVHVDVQIVKLRKTRPQTKSRSQTYSNAYHTTYHTTLATGEGGQSVPGRASSTCRGGGHDRVSRVYGRQYSSRWAVRYAHKELRAGSTERHMRKIFARSASLCM